MLEAEGMEPEVKETSPSAHDLVHACKVFLNVYAITQRGGPWSFEQLQNAVAWADLVEKACVSITRSPPSAARAAVQACNYLQYTFYGYDDGTKTVNKNGNTIALTDTTVHEM